MKCHCMYSYCAACLSFKQHNISMFTQQKEAPTEGCELIVQPNFRNHTFQHSASWLQISCSGKTSTKSKNVLIHLGHYSAQKYCFPSFLRILLMSLSWIITPFHQYVKLGGKAQRPQGSKFHRCFVPLNYNQLGLRRLIRGFMRVDQSIVRWRLCQTSAMFTLNYRRDYCVSTFAGKEPASSSWTWMTTAKQG